MIPLLSSVLLALMLFLPSTALAVETGASLFQNNCASCHPNGENIIRRGRTLKMKALTKRGLDSSEAIAQVAREGIGQMSGYADALGEDGDVFVAEWVWQQAQKAWTQG
ncbi:c-type cytochrome [Synechococcus sp. CC9311]|uniref:c-type cytochrome n=1 Tax=Synechococcus sp. (strain CC9311) TaxID=64471 RepID=UPI0000DDB05C|nr:c-type cytochrome [Synechococcus sp. CC9311]ABI46052.1 Cytochrome c, class IC:Cytochrome c, class I [Synechococcus sp. CC9311]